MSARLRCVRCLRPASGARALSSAMRFCASTSVVRPGMDLAMEAWIVVMRLRARRSVRSFGLRGKLPSVAMSLSVKSMHS